MSEWDLEVDLDMLMKCTGCDESGVSIQNVYLSDVALVVHVACAIIDPLSEKAKESLGSLLRFLSGCAEQVGFAVPVLCVANASGSDGKKVQATLNQWAADQDWHRGDFSITVMPTGEDAKSAADKLLGSAAEVWPNITLEAFDFNAFLSAFESESRARQVPADHASLLAAIATALREDAEDSISRWLDERKNDVRQFVMEREEDGP